MNRSRAHSETHVLKPDDILPVETAKDQSESRAVTSSRVVRKTGSAVRRATDIVLGDFGAAGDAGQSRGSGFAGFGSSGGGSGSRPSAENDAPSEEQIREKIRLAVERDLKAAFEAQAAAQSAAYEQQISDLRAEHEEEMQQAVATVAALIEGWGAAAARFYEDAERDLVTLAIDTADAVTDRPLTDDEINTVTQSLGWAIERLAGDGPIDVRVSPALLDRMQTMNIVPETEARRPVRWHVDKALDEGDYVALTATASIRAVRREAIERARRQLLAHTRPDDGGDDGDDRDSPSELPDEQNDPTT